MSKSNNVFATDSSVSLLVVAYLRPENLKVILETAYESGIRNFFVSIDFPRNPSAENLDLSSKVSRVVTDFELGSQAKVTTAVRDKNVGCTPAVLSSCDWAFSQSENLIILEDDCIPTSDFFDFCRTSLSVIKQDSSIWLAGGSQLVPIELINDPWFSSKYPLTWGWCTTSDKWTLIRNSLSTPDGKLTKVNSPELSLHERRYWNAGAKRAFSGISDAWDTPLVQQMLLNKALTILPKRPLISNVGNDRVATHTHGDAVGLRADTGTFSTPEHSPKRNLEVENWFRNDFYAIKFRHLLSTRITSLIDIVMMRKFRGKSLVESWNLARL
jgi:hypothetical protein